VTATGYQFAARNQPEGEQHHARHPDVLERAPESG
jgi:hypothetical protein